MITYKCLGDDMIPCTFTCSDGMAMNTHRQQVHKDKAIIAMENTVISLVESVLAKHGINEGFVPARKEDVDRVIRLLEKGV